MAAPSACGGSAGATDDGSSESRSCPRGRGRPKLMTDAEQAGMILTAARGVYLERGFAGTTMEDVATIAHVSKRTLYRLFASKTALFAAMVDAHTETMLALPGDYDELPLVEALEAIFRLDIDSDAERERLALLRLFMVDARQFPELGALLRERGGDRSLALLGGWLERQRQNGRIEIDDAAIGARMLMDMIFGAVVLKSGEGPEWPGDGDRRIYLSRCIRVFVNGVRPR
jgi:TetR/AcrR family transcriptional repressor of mexJK operon